MLEGRSLAEASGGWRSNCKWMEESRYKAGLRDVASLRSISLYLMAKLVLFGGRRAVSVLG